MIKTTISGVGEAEIFTVPKGRLLWTVVAVAIGP